MREAVKILKAVESAYGVSFDLVPFRAVDSTTWRREKSGRGAFESCKAADAILLGAVGLRVAVLAERRCRFFRGRCGSLDCGSAWTSMRTSAPPNLSERSTPRSTTGSSWCGAREGGLRHRPGEHGRTLHADRGFLDRGASRNSRSTAASSRGKGAERVIRFAFEMSRQRKGRAVGWEAPSDVRGQVERHRRMQLFRQVYDEVATRYPTIQKDYAYIDAFQQWLIRSPEVYDVAVTSNLFGDIATDLAAVLQGGMGMAASGTSATSARCSSRFTAARRSMRERTRQPDRDDPRGPDDARLARPKKRG